LLGAWIWRKKRKMAKKWNSIRGWELQNTGMLFNEPQSKKKRNVERRRRRFQESDILFYFALRQKIKSTNVKGHKLQLQLQQT
jgi:hypothetical protein